MKNEEPTIENIAQDATGLCIGIAIIILNSLQTAVLRREKRNKTYIKALLSLSVADILLGLFTVITSSLSVFRITSLDASTVVFPTFFSVIASVTHILLIATDRLCAIIIPTRRQAFVATLNMKKAVICVWAVSTAITLISMGIQRAIAKEGENMANRMGLGILIITADTIHFMVACVIVSKLRNMQQPNGDNQSQRQESAQLKKSINITIMIAACFAIFTLPYAMTALLQIDEKWSNKALAANSAMNSVLYFIQNKKMNCSQKVKRVNAAPANPTQTSNS